MRLKCDFRNAVDTKIKEPRVQTRFLLAARRHPNLNFYVLCIIHNFLLNLTCAKLIRNSGVSEYIIIF